MTRLLVLALATTTLGTTAIAQRLPRGAVAEELLTRSHIAASGRGERVRLGGLGARLLWRPAVGANASAVMAALADRALVGGFVSYAPRRLGVSTLHYGAHADLRLPVSLGVAGADRLEPVASLAAGAFRVSRAAERSELGLGPVPCAAVETGERFCFRNARVTLADGSHAAVASRFPAGAARTSLALTPALGVRAPLSRGGLALRADLRDVVGFRGGAIHNPELAAGVSIRL